MDMIDKFTKEERRFIIMAMDYMITRTPYDKVHQMKEAIDIYQTVYEKLYEGYMKD